jgi:hypothetical protein
LNAGFVGDEARWSQERMSIPVLGRLLFLLVISMERAIADPDFHSYLSLTDSFRNQRSARWILWTHDKICEEESNGTTSAND